MKYPIVVFALLVGSAFAADEWSNFQPETVLAYSCKVSAVNYVANGEKGSGQDFWEADAHADRKSDQWGKTIARFEHTLKGRHQAEKACSKWMDEATKRIKALHKGEQ